MTIPTKADVEQLGADVVESLEKLLSFYPLMGAGSDLLVEGSETIRKMVVKIAEDIEAERKRIEEAGGETGDG